MNSTDKINENIDNKVVAKLLVRIIQEEKSFGNDYSITEGEKVKTIKGFIEEEIK